MNLTTEQIQAILDGAPEKNYLSLEPTHYDAHNGDYFILWVGTESGAHSEVWDGNEWVEDEGSKPVFPVPLYSYREILTLRQEVERLKIEVESKNHDIIEAVKKARTQWAREDVASIKNRESEVAARAVENNTIDTIINRLYAERWSGDLSEAPVAEKRGQLQKTLQNQTDGYWSGHTAYNIAVDGGFLIDGKKCSDKRLTALGELFMAQQQSKQIRKGEGDE